MRLDAARLCLDCEEIHDNQVCPSCGSEAFAFLTRWVKPAQPADGSPHPETPDTARATRAKPDAEHLDAWRRILEGKPAAGRGAVVTRGLLGLAAMGLVGWAFQRVSRRARQTAGEPRD
jgi:hypothetical protein